MLHKQNTQTSATLGDKLLQARIIYASRNQETEKLGGCNKMNVEHEVKLLIEEIQRLGKKDAEDHYQVTFGVLFNDDNCANIFEALVGTLRAAKRKKVITYEGELLLQGVHDNVQITLLKDEL